MRATAGFVGDGSAGCKGSKKSGREGVALRGDGIRVQVTREGGWLCFRFRGWETRVTGGESDAHSGGAAKGAHG